MIVLVRNDDRLVHGQCMTRIVQHFKLQRIIVIDDGTAGNPILKLVCERAAMGNYRINVYSTADFEKAVEEAIDSRFNTMVVFRFPTVARKVFDCFGDRLPKELMVGPCQVTEGAVEVNTGCFVSKQYAEDFNYLQDRYGVETYFQPTPDMKRVEWKNIRNKF